jgi:hypothetical protein
MSAHDSIGNGPAHDSTPPAGKSRITYLNIDKTGISMAPKTIIAFVAFIIFLVSGWFAFLSVNATKADLVVHDSSREAHPVKLNKDTEPEALPLIVKANHKAIQQIAEVKKTVNKNTKVIIKVKNGFYEDRAERLADRAADKVRDPRRSRERWKQVRQRAKQNLDADKPIRDGLENYL